MVKGLIFFKRKYSAENDQSSIPSYYVDKDRNIPISDFNDIKGNLTSRYQLTQYILFEIYPFLREGNSRRKINTFINLSV